MADQVRRAIDRGVQFLREQEKGAGNWEAVDRASIITPGGWTSLALLALMHAGVPPADPLIERGLKYLRTVQPAQTYVVALQTAVFASAGRDEDRERIQRNVDWLVATMVKEGERCRGWTYNNEQRNPDNSNTEFALLGLDAGRRAGARIDRKVWEAIRVYYLATQQADHGWMYNLGFRTPTTMTMTTAGLCGLLLCDQVLDAGREQPAADGRANACGNYADANQLAAALAWIDQYFRLELPTNTYYNLFGIGRAGRLCGQRFFNTHDWYRQGCDYLVRKQHPDGAWQEDRFRDAWPVVSTSLALLFLADGRAPVLISKLVHGPGSDWNNDRNDVRNLVDHASAQLFDKRPLAWEVIDTRRRIRPGANSLNYEDIDNLVRDLRRSPIVYLTGHESPEITGADKSILRQYVEKGGLLLAVACCGRKEFDAGFRELMQELFPGQPLKELLGDHPVWRAHVPVPSGDVKLFGIDLGGRTRVLYLPQDFACAWETPPEPAAPSPLAYRLAANIIAYATGKKMPPVRLWGEGK
jgi:hypothetical protein